LITSRKSIEHLSNAEFEFKTRNFNLPSALYTLSYKSDS